MERKEGGGEGRERKQGGRATCILPVFSSLALGPGSWNPLFYHLPPSPYLKCSAAEIEAEIECGSNSHVMCF